MHETSIYKAASGSIIAEIAYAFRPGNIIGYSNVKRKLAI